MGIAWDALRDLGPPQFKQIATEIVKDPVLGFLLRKSNIRVDDRREPWLQSRVFFGVQGGADKTPAEFVDCIQVRQIDALLRMGESIREAFFAKAGAGSRAEDWRMIVRKDHWMKQVVISDTPAMTYVELRSSYDFEHANVESVKEATP